MPTLGKKYICYSCQAKFYDLGKDEPVCPKCGADQREAEDEQVVVLPRSRRIIEADEDEVEAESDSSGDDDEFEADDDSAEETFEASSDDDADDDDDEEY